MSSYSLKFKAKGSQQLNLPARTPRDLPVYTYSALDPERQEIRILNLIPGSPESPIRFTITHESFIIDGDYVNKPRYEALLYTRSTVPIPAVAFIFTNVTGGIPQATLEIEEDLAAALKELRYLDNLRELWIDTVCIDQDNKKECAEQTPRIESIYKEAIRVVVSEIESGR
jgi:hypothetical protein